MIITIVAVGKTKKDFVSAGIVEYEKRIAKYARIKWIFVEASSKTLIKDSIEEETAKIIKQLNPEFPILLLDKSGNTYSSNEFASKLTSLNQKGQIQFVIGGSNGFDSVKFKGEHTVSFSEMTFEHDVVRLMLLEQLYRAFDIQGGGKYHK